MTVISGAPRRTRIVSALAILSAVILVTGGTSACAGLGARSDSSIETSVRARPDSLLRIARTQLEHHGYRVTEAGEGAIMTQPRAVAKHLQDADKSLAGRSWLLRVEAGSRAIIGGSELRVIGYLLPAASRTATAQTMEQATVITSAQQALFSEVRAAATWITDEAKRASRR